jgi:GH15 family glucan-1,4-alpha-glucosidase
MRPIQDYAVIGDCRSAALISRDGSMDWLCWPRFDSPALFAAILDERAGRWSVSPTGSFRSTRRYIPGTNVLETLFETPSGTVLLTDLMPVASEDEKDKLLLPDHQIVRQLECQRGEVEIEVVFQPRPEFAQGTVRWRDAGKLGLRAETASGLLTLRADVPVSAPHDGEVRSTARLRGGDVRYLSLTFDDEWTAVLPPLGEHTRGAVMRSVDWWRAWASQLTYEGPYREAVLRSALTLKLLVYTPSGAIVAAPTTSLPERLGGDLNWDYRFCWPRDAALTMRALLALGFSAEGEALLSWLLHSTRLTQPELRILYDVYGNKPKPERTLQHLAGHRGSRPVRVGNGAANQFQLDLYGEVIDTAAQFVRQGGALDRETQRMLRSFGEYVCRNWNKADEGIWEPRSGRAHHTHSRVLCWTALDRLIELEATGHMRGAPVEDYRKIREIIRREVERRGWNSELQSYVARLDGDDVDASLLLLAWYGFENASSDRMRRTYERIRKRLGAARGLLYRYREKEFSGEGAFGICSFWGAEYLALGGGSAEEARAVFEELVVLGNDVGLFAEEIDPATGDALGNFPQAFTHVGLINAATSLSRKLEGRQSPGPGMPSAQEPTQPKGRA